MVQQIKQKQNTSVGLGCKSISARLAAPVSGTTRSRLSEYEQDALDKLLIEPVEYVDHLDFRKRNAEALVYSGESPAPRRFFSPGLDLLEDPDSLPEKSPPLTANQEVQLFKKFNLARYRVFQIIRAHRNKRLRLASIRTLLAWFGKSLDARDAIAQANVPLVLAMAKRTRIGSVDFSELISEGNMALLRSIDKFDCSRGFKFSTYACRAILKSFSRAAMKSSRYRGRFPTEFDPSLEKSDFIERKRQGVEDDCVDEIRIILRKNAADLNPVEQTVLAARFALDEDADGIDYEPPMTLEQVGVLIGVTKERVRQIQNKALRKIRVVLESGFLAA
jgi:RNA polymerase sigma factor (sigma-70 family)